MIENKYTCYELFKELYKDDRERACNNAYRNDSNEDARLYGSLEDALSFSFSWDRSPEGYDFWEEIYNAISDGTYDQLRAEQKADKYSWHDEETTNDAVLKILEEWAGEAAEEEAGPLPEDAAERKTYPIYSGFINYFPNAIAAVSHLSYKGSKQHQPNQPTQWDMSKSGDELDALMRHMIDGDWEQVAWRAMANLERKLTGNCQYED